VDRPSAKQLVTPKQLGGMLKQIQEAMIGGVYEKMKAIEYYPELV